MEPLRAEFRHFPVDLEWASSVLSRSSLALEFTNCAVSFDFAESRLFSWARRT